MPSDKSKFGYGVLNPVGKKKFRRRIETNSNNALSAVRSAAREQYKSGLSLQGEFHGIVVRKLKAFQADKFSALSYIFSNVTNPEEDKKMDVTQYKVRVPEVHSYIPEPKNTEDYRSINLHDTFDFVGNAEQIAVGQVVRVSFYDNNNAFNPIIKEVTSQRDMSIFSSQKNSSESFKKTNQSSPSSTSGIGSGNKVDNSGVSIEDLPPDTEECNGSLLEEFKRTVKEDWGIQHFNPMNLIKLKNPAYEGPRYCVPPKELWNNMKPTIQALDKIRARYGKAIYITSGYRPVSYNRVLREEDANAKVQKRNNKWYVVTFESESRLRGPFDSFEAADEAFQQIVENTKNTAARRSKHTEFRAIDFYPASRNLDELEPFVYDVLSADIARGSKIGRKRYSSFFHIDYGHKSRTWGRDVKKGTKTLEQARLEAGFSKYGVKV